MDFTKPEPGDIQRLAKQVVVVARFARQLSLPELSGTESDLAVIQAILDSGEIAAEQTYELQCLGIAFGRVLVSATEGLEWAIVHDEYGSDPTLRYRDTSVCLNVLTTISKRVEGSQEVNVRELFEGLQDALRQTLTLT